MGFVCMGKCANLWLDDGMAASLKEVSSDSCWRSSSGSEAVTLRSCRENTWTKFYGELRFRKKGFTWGFAGDPLESFKEFHLKVHQRPEVPAEIPLGVSSEIAPEVFSGFLWEFLLWFLKEFLQKFIQEYFMVFFSGKLSFTNFIWDSSINSFQKLLLRLLQE